MIEGSEELVVELEQEYNDFLRAFKTLYVDRRTENKLQTPHIKEALENDLLLNVLVMKNVLKSEIVDNLTEDLIHVRFNRFNRVLMEEPRSVL